MVSWWSGAMFTERNLVQSVCNTRSASVEGYMVTTLSVSCQLLAHKRCTLLTLVSLVAKSSLLRWKWGHQMNYSVPHLLGYYYNSAGCDGAATKRTHLPITGTWYVISEPVQFSILNYQNPRASFDKWFCSSSQQAIRHFTSFSRLHCPARIQLPCLVLKLRNSLLHFLDCPSLVLSALVQVPSQLLHLHP